MAIVEKLTYLNETKQAIKTSIQNKGVEVADTDTFRSYAEKIDSIESGGIEKYLNTTPTGNYWGGNNTSCLFSEYILEEIPNIDLTNMTFSNGLNYAFYNLKNVKKIGKIKANNVTKLQSVFYDCTKLVEVDLSEIDTSNVTVYGGAFGYCKEITNIPEFDGGKATFLSQFAIYANKLENFNGFIDLGKGYTQTQAMYPQYKLDLHYSELLTHESLINIINNLYDLNLTYDVANGGTLYEQELVLGDTNLAKLTDSEKLIAQSKGWVLS